MTKILHAQVLRLLAAMFFVATATYASPSASAQAPRVIAPRSSRGQMARPMAQHGDGRRIRPRCDHGIRPGRPSQSATAVSRLFAGAPPAGHNPGAKVITESAELVVPVGDCGELDARQVTVAPATALNSTQQIHGYHEVVD